jgi:hypothetical protein
MLYQIPIGRRFWPSPKNLGIIPECIIKDPKELSNFEAVGIITFFGMTTKYMGRTNFPFFQKSFSLQALTIHF